MKKKFKNIKIYFKEKNIKVKGQTTYFRVLVF